MRWRLLALLIALPLYLCQSVPDVPSITSLQVSPTVIDGGDQWLNLTLVIQSRSPIYFFQGYIANASSEFFLPRPIALSGFQFANSTTTNCCQWQYSGPIYYIPSSFQPGNYIVVPELIYVINQAWRMQNYTLSAATFSVINTEPTYIVSTGIPDEPTAELLYFYTEPDTITNGGVLTVTVGVLSKAPPIEVIAQLTPTNFPTLSRQTLASNFNLKYARNVTKPFQNQCCLWEWTFIVYSFSEYDRTGEWRLSIVDIRTADGVTAYLMDYYLNFWVLNDKVSPLLQPPPEITKVVCPSLINVNSTLSCDVLAYSTYPPDMLWWTLTFVQEGYSFTVTSSMEKIFNPTNTTLPGQPISSWRIPITWTFSNSPGTYYIQTIQIADPQGLWSNIFSNDTSPIIVTVVPN